MREINGNRDCIFLGHEQDNESLAVKFNVQKFYNACGEGGQFHLRHKRAIDPDAYPVPASQVELDGNVLTWIVRAEDLIRGEGLLQIKYYDGDVVLMSEIHKTLCKESLGTSATPPSPWDSYLDEVEQDADRAEEYANRAEAAASHNPYIDSETDTWWVWDTDEEAYVDTEVNAYGEDGFSPIVTVTDITGGHRITITDADGTHTVDVMNGGQSGGTKGQVLEKNSNEDYDTVWVDAASRTQAIPYATIDPTSTSTAFKATVPGITELKSGTCVLLRNMTTSAITPSSYAWTLNINNLGAKAVANNSNQSPGDSAWFNPGRAMLFVYDETGSGTWIAYLGYPKDPPVDSIGYRLRTNSSTRPAADAVYRYKLLFTSADGTKWVPANTENLSNATAARTVNQRPIDPFGDIAYYNSTTSVTSGSNVSISSIWQQDTLSLGYSFNRTGSALTLTYPAPVYIKCAPQNDGSAIIDADTPFVQSLPGTNDGKIYIYLGRAYSATQVELILNHPIYYHDGTGISLWTGNTEKSVLYDTTANWNSRLSFVPDAGAIVVYSDFTTVDGNNVPNIKIGDGMAYVVDLPFVNDDMRSVILSHISDTTRHITAAERDAWNNKVTCNVTLISGTDYQLNFSY